MLEPESRPTPEVSMPPEMLPESVPVFDPYVLAEAEFNRRVEVLQEAGEMHR